LLAQALALDGGRYATPYNVVRALRQRPIRVSAPAQSAAVQLLTVHGAKGLEAETVFVLDTDPEPPRASQPGLMVDWPLHERAPTCVAFVANEQRCPPSMRALDEAEQVLRAREDLNVLYVAMTRARQRLVVSRTPPRSADPCAWWPRLLPFAARWSPHPEGRIDADANAAAPQVAVLPTVVLMPPALPETQAIPRAVAEGDAAARLGQAVHRMLEWAAQPGADESNHAVLAESAVLALELPAEQAETVLRTASRILKSPMLAPFFDPAALRWAGNEVPVAVDGASLRIDRLVQMNSDGCWWVLDYKLNTAPEKLQSNREQLLRYRAAVASLQPGEPVRAAFIAGRGRLVVLD
jgi:ATP-dependent helicase/nuclease subunit A